MTDPDRRALLTEARQTLSAAQAACDYAYRVLLEDALPADTDTAQDPARQLARLLVHEMAHPLRWIDNYHRWLTDLGWAPGEPQILTIDDIATLLKDRAADPPATQEEPNQ